AGDGRTVEDIYPLTPTQAGMIFHNLVDGLSAAYLNQVQLRLAGVSNPQALGSAWQRVVDRTPVLRASVVWEGVDQPLQVVHRNVTVPVTHRDWTGLSENQQPTERDRLLAEERAHGLDLAAAPLLRVAIAALGGGEVLLVLTMHHVLLDGWSEAQVLAEVCEQ